jgi:hypothetical protein
MKIKIIESRISNVETTQSRNITYSDLLKKA